MGHCSGGPATDQFDMLSALVDWVENGDAPARVIASARGAGNVGGVNAEVPASWAADRTRPLCAYPRIARYRGGDPERAESFVLQVSRPGLESRRVSCSVDARPAASRFGPAAVGNLE